MMAGRRLLKDGGQVVVWTFLLMVLAGCVVGPAFCQDKGDGALAGTEEAAAYRLLDETLQANLAGEKQRLSEIVARKKAAAEASAQYAERLENYRLKLSTHRNILNLPQFDEYALKEARVENQAALSKIVGRQQALKTELAEITVLKEQVLDNLAAYEKQQKDLRKTLIKPPDGLGLPGALKELMETLSTQKAALVEMETDYTRLFTQFQAFGDQFADLSRQFEQRLNSESRVQLSARGPSLWGLLSKDPLVLETGRLFEKTMTLTSLSYWGGYGVPDRRAYWGFVANFFGLWFIVSVLLLACKAMLRRWRDFCRGKEAFWQYLTLRLTRRSLLMLGTIFFLRHYPVDPIYRFTPLFMTLDLIQQLLIVLLLIRWGLNFLQVIRQDMAHRFFQEIGDYLRLLLYGLLGYSTLYVFTGWVLGDRAYMLTLLRLVLGGLSLVWLALFWPRCHRGLRELEQAGMKWVRYIRKLPLIIGYGITLTGLVGDLAGFNAFAAYWYHSWAFSAAVLLWLSVCHMALKEADAAVQASSSPEAESDGSRGDDDDESRETAPVKWLLIRLGKLALMISLVVGLPMAWGGRRIFLSELLSAANYQVALGNVGVSALEIVLAILFIFIFHTFVVIWKSVLKDNVLSRRQLDPGFKDAITTITGYVLWIIGLLIVLRIIGISVTSLAVFFGALGIGLGFGLQNIFNNFLSGLILLFERPIKVGDVIDLNGTLGKVRKINVRSTRVTTYDNTDLIIPNAQFISEQLTNWSFRDARIRRLITVGVAYGSDTQLVRETLIDVAYNHPRIYRRPAPQVYFEDFGDSSLVFQLRVWMHIDYFISVETDLRFEIDRRFRELGITIPFPQRDVHIRSSSKI